MSDELRQIGQFFRLICLSLKEQQSGSGRMDTRLARAEQAVAQVVSLFGEVRLELGASAQRQGQIVKTLEETIELMADTALHDAHQRTRLLELDHRVSQLERWRDEKEAS